MRTSANRRTQASVRLRRLTRNPAARRQAHATRSHATQQPVRVVAIVGHALGHHVVEPTPATKG